MFSTLAEKEMDLFYTTELQKLKQHPADILQSNKIIQVLKEVADFWLKIRVLTENLKKKIKKAFVVPRNI